MHEVLRKVQKGQARLEDDTSPVSLIISRHMDPYGME